MGGIFTTNTHKASRTTARSKKFFTQRREGNLSYEGTKFTEYTEESLLLPNYTIPILNIPVQKFQSKKFSRGGAKNAEE